MSPERSRRRLTPGAIDHRTDWHAGCSAHAAVLYPYQLIVVLRDRPEVMRAILDARHQWPAGTAVMFDRRKADRRVRVDHVLVERRARQRRSVPDSVSSTRGFVVAEVAALPPQSAILRPPDALPPRPPTPSGGNPGARAHNGLR